MPASQSTDRPLLIVAGRLRGRRLPEPRVFCAAIRRELATGSRRPRLAWWRGALALCEWYADTDRERFAAVLTQFAAGPDDWAAAQGARWLLARWRGDLGPGAEPIAAGRRQTGAAVVAERPAR